MNLNMQTEMLYLQALANIIRSAVVSTPPDARKLLLQHPEHRVPLKLVQQRFVLVAWVVLYQIITDLIGYEFGEFRIEGVWLVEEEVRVETVVIPPAQRPKLCVRGCEDRAQIPLSAGLGFDQMLATPGHEILIRHVPENFSGKLPVDLVQLVQEDGAALRGGGVMDCEMNVGFSCRVSRPDSCLVVTGQQRIDWVSYLSDKTYEYLWLSRSSP